MADDDRLDVLPESQMRALSVEDLGRAFDVYGPVLLGFCRRHAPHDAEDLLSVIFLETWRSRNRAVWVDDSLLPWLYGVAKNVVRSSNRSMRRHRAALERFAATYPNDVVEDPAEEVHARLDASAASADVEAALARLSVKDREIAQLCLLGGDSTASAAYILGIPEGTAKSRLAHARAALRPLLRSKYSETTSDPAATNGHKPGRRDERVQKATTRGAG